MARTPLSPLLCDRAYWRERLADVEALTEPFAVVTRALPFDTPATVEELSARTMEGTVVRALLVRPRDVTRASRIEVVVRGTPSAADVGGAGAGPEWPDLEELLARTSSGRAVLLVAQDLGRRLEERVLDVLRAVACARRCDRLAPDTVEIDACDDDAARICRDVLRHVDE